MSYAQYLRELLRPLGVYDLTAPFNGGELDGAGVGLDGADVRLDEILRESLLVTAEAYGLERIATLLARRPVTEIHGRWERRWPPSCVSAGTAFPSLPSTTPFQAAASRPG